MSVDATAVFIVVLPEINSGKAHWTIYAHFILMQVIAFLVFWSHTACMMTDPGRFPKFQKLIDPQKLKDNAKDLFETACLAQEEIRNRKLKAAGEEVEELDKSKYDTKIIEKVSKMTGTEKSLVVALFKNKCRKCESLKPPKSHHCRE
mmetsp:Transcript_13853/g.12278  ORF Transcript_13853/g.12278 Transcript_13853/m.12278 type:complete len:148 (+) Transcript_13853:56-499(+)